MPQLPQIDSLKAPDRAVAQATRTRRFPWLNLPFVVVVALIVCYGLVVVMSAVANDPDYSFSRQLAGVAAGIVAMIVAWRFDYRRLSDFTTLFLIVNVVLILSPHIPGLGVEAKGAQSWIKLGIQIQPESSRRSRSSCSTRASWRATAGGSTTRASTRRPWASCSCRFCAS